MQSEGKRSRRFEAAKFFPFALLTSNELFLSEQWLRREKIVSSVPHCFNQALLQTIASMLNDDTVSRFAFYSGKKWNQ